ncbi:MAG: nicotinate (nicotinamide) nucleotide adenylyltransferase [Acidobacteriota bacterium]
MTRPGPGLGLLGGTFDPVHRGHLAVAEAVRDGFRLPRILLLPALLPPHKGSHRLTGFEHRLRMVEAACRGRRGLEASPYEGTHPGPSYTVETLAHFRSLVGAGPPLYFVLGADSLAEIHGWREPRRILSLAHVIVAPRPGTSREAAEAALLPDLAARVRPRDDAAAPPAGCIYWLEMDSIELSGSEVRRRVRSGKSIAGLVPDAVSEYIHRHHLYGGNEDS